MDRCLYVEGKVVNSTHLHKNVEFCVKCRVLLCMRIISRKISSFEAYLV